MKQIKKFISFSGGVESRTMAILFGNKADAIFADTGSEHQALYDQLDEVELKIREFHGNDFKIIRVQQKNAEGTGATTLEEYIRYTKYFPSFNSRFCTRLFKIEPIDDFLKQFKEEGVEIMIGLNADEADMRTGNHGLLSFVNYSYPLIEKGINRRMCLEILKSAGLAPEFPPYMQRGGCKFCYYKSKKEYAAMAILNPDEFQEVVKLEIDIQDKRKKYYNIVPSIKNMNDFGKHARNILFKPEEIYPVKNDVTSCGVFCNR